MTLSAKNVLFCAHLSYYCYVAARDKSPTQIEVSITVLHQMFLYLDSLNVDIDMFLRSLSLDPATIKSPDTYIPIETYLLIQDEAARYTNDPYYSLHMGEYAEAGSWPILASRPWERIFTFLNVRAAASKEPVFTRYDEPSQC